MSWRGLERNTDYLSQAALMEWPAMPERMQDGRCMDADAQTQDQGNPAVLALVLDGQFVQGRRLFRRLRLGGRTHHTCPPHRHDEHSARAQR